MLIIYSQFKQNKHNLVQGSGLLKRSDLFVKKIQLLPLFLKGRRLRSLTCFRSRAPLTLKASWGDNLDSTRYNTAYNPLFLNKKKSLNDNYGDYKKVSLFFSPVSCGKTYWLFSGFPSVELFTPRRLFRLFRVSLTAYLLLGFKGPIHAISSALYPLYIFVNYPTFLFNSQYNNAYSRYKKI